MSSTLTPPDKERVKELTTHVLVKLKLSPCEGDRLKSTSSLLVKHYGIDPATLDLKILRGFLELDRWKLGALAEEIGVSHRSKKVDLDLAVEIARRVEVTGGSRVELAKRIAKGISGEKINTTGWVQAFEALRLGRAKLLEFLNEYPNRLPEVAYRLKIGEFRKRRHDRRRLDRRANRVKRLEQGSLLLAFKKCLEESLKGEDNFEVDKLKAALEEKWLEINPKILPAGHLGKKFIPGHPYEWSPVQRECLETFGLLQAFPRPVEGTYL